MVEERLNYPVNHRYQIIAFSTFNIITSQRTSLYQIATCTFQLIIANGFDIRTDIEIDAVIGSIPDCSSVADIEAKVVSNPNDCNL